MTIIVIAMYWTNQNVRFGESCLKNSWGSHVTFRVLFATNHKGRIFFPQFSPLPGFRCLLTAVTEVWKMEYNLEHYFNSKNFIVKDADMRIPTHLQIYNWRPNISETLSVFYVEVFWTILELLAKKEKRICGYHKEWADANSDKLWTYFAAQKKGEKPIILKTIIILN